MLDSNKVMTITKELFAVGVNESDVWINTYMDILDSLDTDTICKFIRTNVNRLDILKALSFRKATRFYHGTSDRNLKPSVDGGKENNDYGRGFYLTNTPELSKEWAWSQFNGHKQENGYSFKFSFSWDNLTVLDLTVYTPLTWMAILLKHRTDNDTDMFGDNDPDVVKFINDYYIDVTSKDVIIGYRADDSMFAIKTAFLLNRLSLQGLKEALHTGGLGLQLCLKSAAAYTNLTFDTCIEVPRHYREKDTERRRIADKLVRQLIEKDKQRKDRVYFVDVVRGEKYV